MGSLRAAYEVMGLTPAASLGEVAEAYRSLVQIYHPDRYAEAPERVRVEAERRMQELNDAYRLVRRPSSAAAVTDPAPAPTPTAAAARRPEPTRPAEPVVGRPAEPLEAPTLPYSKGQWDAATRAWRWADDFHTWRCRHDKDMCATCGATPDAVAMKAGVQRPPGTWRRSMRGEWVCSAHHRGTCDACGTPPRGDARVDVRPGSPPAGTGRRPAPRLRQERSRWH